MPQRINIRGWGKVFFLKIDIVFTIGDLTVITDSHISKNIVHKQFKTKNFLIETLKNTIQKRIKSCLKDQSMRMDEIIKRCLDSDAHGNFIGLKDSISFNLFEYITFRSGISAIIALLISFTIDHGLSILQNQIGEERPTGPNSHMEKGTPTMGGVIILIAVLLPTFFF